jgi:putative DNA primase/helicase
MLGAAPEDTLALIYGPGGTGKTTVMEAVRQTFGDYATTADFSTFVRKQAGGIPNDIARLQGARLVVASEVEDGAQFAAALVKQLTGGDTITARFLHREFFEFEAVFLLLLIANHKPKVRADDDAMWRRIRVIPLDRPVPAGTIDPKLKERLRSPENQTAILSWLVEGYRAYRQLGFGEPPSAVEEATAEYQREMDQAALFLDEACVKRTDAWTPSDSLRIHWEAWARDNGFEPSYADLTRALKAAGCKTKSRRHGEGGAPKRGWIGIGLLNVDAVTAVDGRHPLHARGDGDAEDQENEGETPIGVTSVNAVNEARSLQEAARVVERDPLALFKQRFDATEFGAASAANQYNHPAEG